MNLAEKTEFSPNGHSVHQGKPEKPNLDPQERLNKLLEQPLGNLEKKLFTDKRFKQDIANASKEISHLLNVSADQRRQLFVSRIADIVSFHLLYSPISMFRLDAEDHQDEMLRVGFATSFFTVRPEIGDKELWRSIVKGEHYYQWANRAHQQILRAIPKHFEDLPEEFAGAVEDYAEENPLYMNSRQITQYLLEFGGGDNAQIAAKELFDRDVEQFYSDHPEIKALIDGNDLAKDARRVAQYIIDSEQIRKSIFPSSQNYLEIAREWVFNRPASPFFLRRIFVKSDMPDEFLETVEAQLVLASGVLRLSAGEVTSAEAYIASELTMASSKFLREVLEILAREVQFTKSRIRREETRERKIDGFVKGAMHPDGIFNGSEDLLASWLRTAKTFRLTHLDITPALNKNGVLRKRANLKKKDKIESSRDDYQKIEAFLEEFPQIAVQVRMPESQLALVASEIVAVLGPEHLNNSSRNLDPEAVLSTVTEAIFHSQHSPFRFVDLKAIDGLSDSFLLEYIDLLHMVGKMPSQVGSIGWEKYVGTLIIRKIWVCTYYACWHYLSALHHSGKYPKISKESGLKRYWLNVMKPHLDEKLGPLNPVAVDLGKLELMVKGLEIEKANKYQPVG